MEMFDRQKNTELLLHYLFFQNGMPFFFSIVPSGKFNIRLNKELTFTLLEGVSNFSKCFKSQCIELFSRFASETVFHQHSAKSKRCHNKLFNLYTRKTNFTKRLPCLGTVVRTHEKYWAVFCFFVRTMVFKSICTGQNAIVTWCIRFQLFPLKHG